jgi:DNA-binding NarL/FixJ family response regulator
MIGGRCTELAALQRALAEAEAAQPTPVLLVGDPGIGKSVLLRTISGFARGSGFTVMAAACPEGSGNVRYGVIDDLVHSAPFLIGRLSDSDRAILAGLPDRDSPGAARVATALLRLLTAADSSAPVLLVVDDLHAADADSVAALTLAAGRLAGRRVAVVASVCRHAAGDARLATWDRLDVGPLEPEAAVELLLKALPAASRDHLPLARARALADALGRNPTALRECPRLLTVDELSGTSALPVPVPVGQRLGSAWGRAFDSLTEAQQDAVLATFITAGHGRPLRDLVMTRLGTTPEELGQAHAVGLVPAPDVGSADPLAELGQPLISAATLACAGEDRVRAIHRLAAQVARELDLRPAIVVAHLKAGATNPDPEAVRTLEAEAGRALDRGQVTAAARALETAAVLCEAPARRAGLAVRAAELHLSVGQTVDDPGALLEILATVDLDAQGEVSAELLRSQHMTTHDLRASLAALHRAVEHARHVNSPALPQILTGASFQAWAVGDGTGALKLADAFVEWESLAGADAALRSPAWAGTALRGIARFQVGEVRAADPDLVAARQASAAWIPQPDVDLALLVNVVLLDEVLSTRRRLSDPRLDQAVRRLEGGSGETLGIIRNIQAGRALRRGDLTVARVLVDEGLDLARAALLAHNILLRLCTAVRIDAIVGDRERLSIELGEIRTLCDRLGHVWGHAYADRAEGLLALSHGRHDDAVTVLSRLTDDLLLGMGPADPVPMGRGDLAEALMAAGDRAGARKVAGDLSALLVGSSAPAARALSARAMGVVTSGPRGVRALGDAVEQWRRAGEAFETARTRMLLGERLAEQGEVQPAGTALRAAARAFDLMGAQPWHDRTLTALRAIDVADAAEPDPATCAVTLTGAEWRVARAVAEGATNKEAAARLSVSPRTVEHHLAAAYRKLGVHSRTALVARLLAGSAVGEESEPLI